MPARKAKGSVSHLPIRDVKEHLPKEDNDVPYTNNLNQFMNTHNIEQKKMAEALLCDYSTISKHRKGQSPIGWDVAQMYSKYFIYEYDLMIDAFTLLTGKNYPEDTLHYNTLEPGQITILGQFLNQDKCVKFFQHDQSRVYLTSTMYNHYIFKNAEDWGLNALIYVEGNHTKPFTNIDEFYYDDYQYWVFLKSPIVHNHVHAKALRNLSICKIKGEDIILAGSLYEKPKRNSQSPTVYELADPYFGLEESFLPTALNTDGIELDWATPVISIITNPSASGINLEQNGAEK